jgi:hypothetical protein
MLTVLNCWKIGARITKMKKILVQEMYPAENSSKDTANKMMQIQNLKPVTHPTKELSIVWDKNLVGNNLSKGYIQTGVLRA